MRVRSKSRPLPKEADPLAGWKVGEVREVQWLARDRPVPEGYEVAPHAVTQHSKYSTLIRKSNGPTKIRKSDHQA